jgi:hypothetical protein
MLLLLLLLQQTHALHYSTLEAFDDLLDLGVAVEMMGAPADEAAAAPRQKSGICKEGTRVTLHCQAFAWDGASNCMRRYAGTSRGSTLLRFTVGAGHVPAGQLQAPLQLLCVYCC